MNIEKAREFVGIIMRDYKVFCEVLNEEPKEGDSKQAHLRELAQYMRLTRQGRRIIIEEVYEEPKPKYDRRRKEYKNKKGNI